MIATMKRLVSGLMLVMVTGVAAQEAGAAGAGASVAGAQEQQGVQAPAVVPVAAPAVKGKKAVYTGPTTLEELPPTPMLDEEGRQRLDPDGKPMFNAPVRQQRDKYGHPLFDGEGHAVMQTPTELGYDERGKKIRAKKEKPAKTVSVAISRGTLTVDGMIGKAALNYDIADLKYIYFYAPWVGTVVVSNAMFPGAKEQAHAFDQKTLTVTVDEHTFQLYSDKMLLGKKPEAAFVAVNRDFRLPTTVPVMGYGATLRAPYVWPGAKENPVLKGSVQPPPVPASLRPMALLPPCPEGQMRGPVLPGQTAAPACVAIDAGKAPVVGSAPAVGKAPQ